MVYDRACGLYDLTQMKFLLLLCSVLAIGCAETRTYEVSVRNQSQKPMTVWLTKTAGPYEKNWKAPEELAWQHLSDDEAFNGLTIPPGKTGYTGKVHGSFNAGSAAVLRVYIGVTNYNETLAMSKGDPNRVDLMLKPGKNSFIAVPDEANVKLERVAD